MKVLLGATATTVLVAGASIGAGKYLFERRISREVDELLAAGQGEQPTIVADAGLDELPEPVQRWLRNAGVVGRERPRSLRLKQEGEFRLGEEKGWMPFTAEQHFTTNPPGFVWKATFEMAPFVKIIGRDRYADGTSDIDMRLLAMVPVAKKSGGGLNQGALLRYLGEIVWFPAAAMSSFITWEGIDTSSARATMSYLGVTASAAFIFDRKGRVTRVSAQRYNDAKGGIKSWTIPVERYGAFDGISVPVEGEGVWNYPAGDFSYIRWRVTDIDYNFRSHGEMPNGRIGEEGPGAAHNDESRCPPLRLASDGRATSVAN